MKIGWRSWRTRKITRKEAFRVWFLLSQVGGKPAQPSMKAIFYNVKGLSEYINVKPKTVYSWVTQGILPFYRIGGCIRFKKAEIDEWLLKCSMKKK